MTEITALSVHGLQRTFRRGHRIGPVSFSVAPGECFGLVGANGAGKTTILRALVALECPDEGTITALGERVRPFTPTPGVSGMIEEPRFFGGLDGADNLRAAFPHRRLRRAEVEEMLDYVGLAKAGRQRVRAYSQGMRQRLGIGRVLLARPDVIVLDEPTNGLDPVGVRWLRSVIAEQQSAGAAVILSSHMLPEVQSVADGFLMIDHGRAIVQGRVKDIAHVDGLEGLYFETVADEHAR